MAEGDDKTPIILGAAALLVVGVLLIGAYVMMRGDDTAGVARAPGTQIFSRPAEAPPAPAPAASGMQDSTSLLQNTLPQGSSKTPDAAAGTSARPAEKAFLAAHDGKIRAYQAQLNAIGQRYYQKYPLVREVDADFGKLDRYMAVKRRYEQDRDVYKWARDTAALPEVRSTIKKYMGNPQAWSIGMDMVLESLKNPPPREVYNEARRFMTEDEGLMGLTTEVAMEAQKNLGAATTGMQGKDLSKINTLISDLSPAPRK